MGAHCFFPTVFLPSIVLTTGPVPRSSVNIVRSIRSSLFQNRVGARARNLPLSRNAKVCPARGARLRKRKDKKGERASGKGKREWDKSGEQWAKVGLSCKRDRSGGEHAVAKMRVAPRAGHTSVSFIRPARSVYLRANNRPHRGKTNSSSFSHRIKILYLAGADANAGLDRFVPVPQLTMFVCDDEDLKIFWLCDDTKVMF